MQVIFGTGALGLAVMRELVRKGKRVRMINRTSKVQLPANVELIQGDAKDTQFCIAVCKEASVIYNCMGLPYEQWMTQLPAMQRGIIEGAASSGAKLIYADNHYAYGPHSSNYHEDLPDNPVGIKTALRAELSQMVLQAHRAGTIRATIGRGADFYGPHVKLAVLGARVFQPALTGGFAEVIGDIDQPHTHIYIDDFASGLIALSEHEEALGQVWHIPAAETVTTRQLIEMIYREAGNPPKYRTANGLLLTVMVVHPLHARVQRDLVYLESTVHNRS
jgi:nucleoside-diphosphate-sugar epimerase